MRTETDTFANWLEEMLAKRNMIPIELSRKSGIAKSAVSNILNNQRKPDVDTLIAFANALQISRLEIFTAAGLMGREGTPQYREEVEQLSKFLSTFDEEDRQFLLDMARTIAERKSKYDSGKGKKKSLSPQSKGNSLHQNAG